MSRAVTKSRADKTKGGGTVPTVAHEIVSGKFTDQDWNSMIERDDSTEFPTELVDEVVDNALSIIYDNYIQQQLLPFTLSQAKDAILQIIDWQFLSRDVLETNLAEDASWQEDEEPLPALTDCWAQGIVPRQVLPSSRLETPQPTDIVLEDVGEEDLAEPTSEEQPAEEEEMMQGEVEVSAEVVEPVEPEPEPESQPEPEETEEKSVKHAQIAPEPPKGKPKRKFKPYKGRLKSAGLGAMTESLYETEMRMMMEESAREMEEYNDNPLSSMPVSCQSLLKSQAGRPPGNKDVIYDEHGNVVAMVKFNPAKLPSHFVKTGFTVVDPEVEAAHARLQAMKTGNYVVQKKKKIASSSLAKKGQAPQDASDKIDFSPRNLVLPLPPPLIELMEVQAGVTVKEGERIKRGAKKWGRTGPQVADDQLRVVRPPPERPRLTAADLLGTEKPILKMIRDSPPIPPINQIPTA